MSENPDHDTPSGGMTRRTFVTRSAVVGGMVWAAPAISTLGSRAFAGTNGTPRDCPAISYLAVVIKNGKTYQFKLDSEGGVETGGDLEAPHCPDPTGWNGPNNIGGYPEGTSWNISDSCCWEVTVPNGYTLVGVAMGAGGTEPKGNSNTAAPNGYCVQDPIIQNGGNTYRFCAPKKTTTESSD